MIRLKLTPPTHITFQVSLTLTLLAVIAACVQNFPMSAACGGLASINLLAGCLFKRY